MCLSLMSEMSLAESGIWTHITQSLRPTRDSSRFGLAHSQGGMGGQWAGTRVATTTRK